MATTQSDAPSGNPDEHILLGVLEAIDRDPGVTQRSMARELGVALGLTNAYLKRCVRKGLIKVSQVPARRYAYYLTPQGFTEKSRLTAAYLTHSFLFFREARLQCSELYAAAAACGHRRLILLGSGDLADIASLVAQDHPVEIAGVVPWTGEIERLKIDVTALGQVDGVIVTALAEPQDAFEFAHMVFGEGRVYAPPLLRLRAPVSSRGSVRSA